MDYKPAIINSVGNCEEDSRSVKEIHSSSCLKLHLFLNISLNILYDKYVELSHDVHNNIIVSKINTLENQQEMRNKLN